MINAQPDLVTGLRSIGVRRFKNKQKCFSKGQEEGCKLDPAHTRG